MHTVQSHIGSKQFPSNGKNGEMQNKKSNAQLAWPYAARTGFSCGPRVLSQL